MDYTSPYFWLLFAGAVGFLVLRNRKKNGPNGLPPKPPVFRERATLLLSPLSKTTPLACLLDDQKKFGSFFQDKTPPALPHEPGCLCHVQEFTADTGLLFKGQTEPELGGQSDLGGLTPTERRYYKYRLIASHPQATKAQQSQFAELAQSLNLGTEFIEKIKTHLEEKL
ncbi:MAG: hypothetical protein A2600_11360 [Candidatus Lambdaproteobacteria bacterium RIFOXYD1_FULL_56_27]|uniref:Uncharacterized protein n=1 Tax=Candidatus Lambdaproteobacteria bacterium RIFOXYD2_FULL_56_26 TaxID=1817773 RepID=A0A1F6H0U7_9PROT|nr:MAG: hypothetical protein A2426_12640 [Candidatus Lambdaproteobacteria bacterium RIFOXYC1_FULL_56_13]OGH03969.1 MAG: hypothetical protein A2557_11120 [Candidatus Lambdaproteobacteria bacterium RIFOXYD2_FULL_56_26]OGH08360.1 MAG: hypothetical protein A2600_11360 [Candidatus Lambdaproteobacteria bacterium RIFOXYD1_FULL_56_27]